MNFKTDATNKTTNWHQDGLGSTSNHRNIEYLGFVKMMKPSQFLSLNPRRRTDPHPIIVDAIKTLKPVAHAQIYADWDSNKSKWQVRSHEGRGRVIAHMQIYGNNPIPIHIIPGQGMRARHITGTHINAEFMPDNRIFNESSKCYADFLIDSILTNS